MNDEIFNKRLNVLKLKEKIKQLNQELNDTKNELDNLEREIYNEYYSLSRVEYAHLISIPDKPDTKSRHILYKYSNLNIDEIGKMICELFLTYENRNVVHKRKNKRGYIKENRGYYHDIVPCLVIGNKEEIDDVTNENNIVIEYNKNSNIKDFPTENSVIWNNNFIGSNYDYLIGEYNNNLSFNYNNYEFIKELIYSLAYYQKQHDIKYMNEAETRRVYKRIYKK